jgi:hypothetical protein
MNRLSDNFETRPDNRAGDIKPIWPLDEREIWVANENDCSINWWGVLGLGLCGASALIVLGGLAWAWGAF